MDQIKESLIYVAGDVTEAEIRILQNVKINLNKSKRKKWLPLLPLTTVIVIAAILFIVFRQAPTEPTQNALLISPPLLEDELSYMQSLIEKEQNDKTNFYYFGIVGLMYYFNELSAQYTLPYDVDEVNSLIQANESALTSIHAVNQHFETEEAYEKYMQLYVPLSVRAEYMLQQVLPIYEEKYPSFNQDVLRDIVLREAIMYFEQTTDGLQFATDVDYAYLLQASNITLRGTVVKIEGDAITIVEGLNYYQYIQSNQKHTFKTYLVPHVGPLLNEELTLGNSYTFSILTDATSIYEFNQFLPTSSTFILRSLTIGEASDILFSSILSNLTFTEGKYDSINPVVYLTEYKHTNYRIAGNLEGTEFTIQRISDGKIATLTDTLQNEFIDLLKNAN